LNFTETLDAFVLRSTQGLGDRGFKRLVDALGSASAVICAEQSELESIGASSLLFDRIRRANENRAQLENLVEVNNANGLSTVCYGADGYPSRLAQIPDPPAILYWTGKFAAVKAAAIAVVGSRRPTTNGIKFTRKLCAGLAEAGITVISGLAAGIDSAAHQGALDASGPTAAVFGNGLDLIYPAINKKLASDILDGGGVWLSELPVGSEPKPHHFPRRNRIISGLALGVLVAEAAEKSGSLITASLALEQGRDVFAVPGFPGAYASKGPHQLLRSGAVLVESAEDVLRELYTSIKLVKQPADKQDEKNDPQPVQSALWRVLEESPLHIDELADLAGIAPAAAAAQLMELTLNGFADELPGKRYRKNIHNQA